MARISAETRTVFEDIVRTACRICARRRYAGAEAIPRTRCMKPYNKRLYEEETRTSVFCEEKNCSTRGAYELVGSLRGRRRSRFGWLLLRNLPPEDERRAPSEP